MPAKVILLFCICFVLFVSCEEEKEPGAAREDTSRIDSPVTAPPPPAAVLTPAPREWKGVYEVDSLLGHTAGGTAIFIGYTVTITDDSVIFNGSGYQTWFTDLCDTRMSGDTLLLFFSQKLEGHSSSYHARLNPLARLYKRGDQYFIRSEAMEFGEEEGVEIKKR